MKKIGLYAVLLFMAFGIKAQVNPYGSLGIETKVLTLSDGKYEEFFDLDSIQQIGTILYNINTGKVVGEVVENEKYYIPKFSASRFISVDPLADMFPNQSPYLYAYNNPVRFIDVDGLYGDEGEATKQRQAAIDGGAKVGDIYQSGDEWGFNVINGEDSYSVFETNFFPEISSTQDNSVNETSNAVSNLDAAGTAITGIGLNWSQIDRAGNKGTRFRADLFGQKYLRLSGEIGEKMTGVIRVGAPLISGASAVYTLRSDQSTQWKAADLTSTVIGVFGGLPGALISIGYGFGVKPLVRPVINPTNAEMRSLHEFQNRNSDSNYCRRKRCR